MTGAPQNKLDLDPGVVAACRQAAKQIADQVSERIAGRTTLSVERSCYAPAGRGRRQ